MASQIINENECKMKLGSTKPNNEDMLETFNFRSKADQDFSPTTRIRAQPKSYKVSPAKKTKIETPAMVTRQNLRLRRLQSAATDLKDDIDKTLDKIPKTKLTHFHPGTKPFSMRDAYCSDTRLIETNLRVCVDRESNGSNLRPHLGLVSRVSVQPFVLSKVTTEKDCFYLHIQLLESYATFNLEKAVCNHGLFMMAPNRWVPSTKTLKRPLRLSNSTSKVVTISSSSDNNISSLLICVHDVVHLSNRDQHAILEQVQRMLRISEKDEKNVLEFHKMHTPAKESDFGRLFRSPTLFEDVVKSILLCNCGWQRTLQMAQSLCEIQGELAKRLKKKGGRTIRGLRGKGKKASKLVSGGDHDEPLSLGNFPNAEELAACDKEWLNKHCKLGYRAYQIIGFAGKFLNNKLNHINKVNDECVMDAKLSDDLCKELLRLDGFGPFVCSNILMCCGYYERIPIDSETRRHLRDYHARQDCNKKNATTITEQVYNEYSPFQCLVYWYELVQSYEEKFGRLSELPSSEYGSVTGSSK